MSDEEREQAEHEPIFTPRDPAGPWTVCRRYEIIHEYVNEINRPLTGLEQRAFIYLLDLDADERFTHSEVPGECVCMEILPVIISALDPDPVDCIVAERNLEDQSYPAQRWHTERIGKFQGITLNHKTKREHIDQLRKLARARLADVEIVLRELLQRKDEYRSKREMVAAEFPKLLELAQFAKRKQPSQAPDWQGARDRLEARRRRGHTLLEEIAASLLKTS